MVHHDTDCQFQPYRFELMPIPQKQNLHLKMQLTHIQNNAQGPPRAMAVATPAILPVPTLPETANANAWKEETPCSDS